MLVLQPEIIFRLLLPRHQRVLLLLNMAQAIELGLPILIQLLQLNGRLVNGFLVAGSTDDILKVLKEAVLGIGAFGLHLGDGLDFALEDEEAVVVEIDASTLE